MEQIVGIVVAMAVFASIASALLSWRAPALFLFMLALIDLHLMLPLQVNIEDGVTIHAGDIFFSALAVATLLRVLSLQRIGGLLWAWLLFSLYLGLTFVHGVSAHGFLTAASAYRSSLYLSVGVAYFSTFEFDEKQIRDLLVLVVIMGVVIILCAVAAWIFPELRPVDVGNYATTVNTYERNRALPAQAAMFTALAFLASLPAWLDQDVGLSRRLATLPLLAAVVLLFHRSVWVSVAIGLIAMMMLMGLRAARILVVIFGAGLALMSLWLMMEAMDVAVVSESFRTAVTEVVESENSTLTWRIDGWRILVERAIADGPISILFGAGFGIGFERTINQSYVVSSPHNIYVEMFLTGGLVSCALFLGTILMTSYALFRHRNPAWQTTIHILIAMVVAQVIYGISYSPQYDGAPLLGAALSIAARLRSVPSFAPARLLRR